MVLWAYPNPVPEPVLGTYDQGTVYTIAGIRRANKKDTGKLLGIHIVCYSWSDRVVFDCEG